MLDVILDGAETARVVVQNFGVLGEGFLYGIECGFEIVLEIILRGHAVADEFGELLDFGFILRRHISEVYHTTDLEERITRIGRGGAHGFWSVLELASAGLSHACDTGSSWPVVSGLRQCLARSTDGLAATKKLPSELEGSLT